MVLTRTSIAPVSRTAAGRIVGDEGVPPFCMQRPQQVAASDVVGIKIAVAGQLHELCTASGAVAIDRIALRQASRAG